jgi:hypothetical protein
MAATTITQAVTHQGSFGLYANLKDPQDRIYSGLASPIVLTVSMTTVPATGALEVIVDGHSIPDGVITQGGSESRTFKLESAKTIDLVLQRPSAEATGTYTISVLD